MTGDPKRLSDSGGDLAAAIGAARRRVAGHEQLAGLAHGLARAGVPMASDAPGTLASPPAAVSPPAAATSVATSPKWWAWGLGGVVTAGVLAVATRGAPTDSAPSPGAEEPATPMSATPTTTEREAPRPAAVEAHRADPATVPAEPAPTTGSVGNAPNTGGTGARGEAGARRGNDVLGARKVSSQNGGEDAGSEVELLKAARDALGSNPARTLSLIEQARARFPGSGLGQERDFLTITALRRLGRTAEANARERTFRERYPRSAYLPQLTRATSQR